MSRSAAGRARGEERLPLTRHLTTRCDDAIRCGAISWTIRSLLSKFPLAPPPPPPPHTHPHSPPSHVSPEELTSREQQCDGLLRRADMMIHPPTLESDPHRRADSRWQARRACRLLRAQEDRTYTPCFRRPSPPFPLGSPHTKPRLCRRVLPFPFHTNRSLYYPACLDSVPQDTRRTSFEMDPLEKSR